jgi:hypothetical protein
MVFDVLIERKSLTKWNTIMLQFDMLVKRTLRPIALLTDLIVTSVVSGYFPGCSTRSFLSILSRELFLLC